MEADWLVGMNGSRTYGIITSQKISVGRVQTPTLALIVKRDMEVENYKESYFYMLTGSFTGLTFTHVEDGKNVVFETEESAYRVRSKCIGIKFGLKTFKKERKVQNPPKPFSMPDLQKEANRRFGFGLDKTLKIAQDLYEAKVTSYPRTDSSYLPPADVDKYYAVIDKFGREPQKSLLISQGEPVPCMKDTQSAHTAIIPTGEDPGQLGDDEAKIFNLIVDRFITAFLRPKVYDQSTITVSDGVHDFRATVNRVIEAGFTSLLPPKAQPRKDKTDKPDNDEEAEEDLQETTVDLDEATFQHPQELKNLNTEKKKRAKPKYYTPATLLTAMMTVGKTLENAEDQEILKEVEGLGTAATRDKIPVELEKRGYIETSGRNIKSTTKGREFINIVKTDLKSAELTARWEQRLRQMEEGNYNAEDFRSEIRAFVKEIVSISDTEAGKIRAAFESVGYKCPKCGQQLRENKSGFFCNDQCGFAAWKSIAGKTIPPKEMDALLAKHETGKINGFISKNGKEFSAKIAIEAPEFKPRFVFDSPEQESSYKCPCCGRLLSRGAKVICCKDCGFTLWLVMAEKTLTESDIKALISKGITGTIKGFKKRDGGGSFDAKLTIDPTTKKVKYLFADKSSEKLAKKVSV